MNRFAHTPLLAGTVTAIVCGLLLMGCGSDRPAAAQSKPSQWQTVKSEMDAASAKFQSAQADIKKEQFEKIVNDTTSQSGTIYFQRVGKSMQMGVKLDNGQAFEFKNGVGRLYDATSNHINEFSASGTNQAKAETYLTLGFGGSGSDLEKEWTITDQGSEQRNDGSKTVTVEKLDLISKDQSARDNFTHITIWIDPVRDVSLRQEFFTPSGDTQTAIYSNIRVGTFDHPVKIDTAVFAIKCKGKCS